MLVLKSSRAGHDCIRLFLFHTAFPSGAPPELLPVPEFILEDDESSPLDLATRRGFGARLLEVGVGEADAPAGLSPFFTATEPVALFAAKNFLFTDTDLNEIGFFVADDVRTCPSPLALSASLSDPPLTLPSVDGTPSSEGSGLGVAGLPSLAVSFKDAGLLESSWVAVFVVV